MSKKKFEDKTEYEIKEQKIDLVKVPYEIKPGKRKHVRFTRVRQKVFLENYLNTANFGKSAYLAGVSRTTVKRELERNEHFKNAFKEIEELHLDRCEEVLQNHVDKETPASITPSIFLLKSKRGEIYGDKAQVNIDHVVYNRGPDSFIKQCLEKMGLIGEADDEEVS